MKSTVANYYEGFALSHGELMGMQSWYFGYILAFAVVLAVLVFANLPRRRSGRAVLWLPSVIMLLVFTGIFILHKLIEPAAIHMSNAYDLLNSRAGMEHIAGSEYEVSDVVSYFVYHAGTGRLIKHFPAYQLTALALSIAAYVLHRKVSAARAVASSACTIALLLVLCLLDRHFALSARLMFEPADDISAFDSLIAASVIYGDEEMQLQLLGVSFERGTYLCREIYDMELGYDIPAYGSPSLFAEKIGTTCRRFRPHLHTKKYSA